MNGSLSGMFRPFRTSKISIFLFVIELSPTKRTGRLSKFWSGTSYKLSSNIENPLKSLNLNDYEKLPYTPKTRNSETFEVRSVYFSNICFPITDLGMLPTFPKKMLDNTL